MTRRAKAKDMEDQLKLTLTQEKNDCEINKISTNTKKIRSLSLSDTELHNVSANLSLNSAMNSTQLEDSNRSLPVANSLEAYFIDDLKRKLEETQSELMSAHEEIIKLNTEITYLRQQSEERNKKIEFLKNFTMNSPITTNTYQTSTYKKKAKPKKIKIDKKVCKILDSTTDVCSQDTTIEVLTNTSKQQDITKKNLAMKKHDEKIKPIEGQTIQRITDNKPGIFILGDQQAKGLSLNLIKSRDRKWNNIYRVSSIVKPNARSTQILESCDHLKKSITESDIVILLLGANDKDPYQLFSEICIALYKLKNCKQVIIPEIQYNPYLNEQLLNHKIKLLVKQFENCIYLDYQSASFENNINNLCFKLNIEIDYLDYKQKYLISINNKNNSNFTVSNSNSICNQLTFEQNKRNLEQKIKDRNVKKGTIPYYFKKENSKKIHNTTQLFHA